MLQPKIRIAMHTDYAQLADIMFDAVRHGRSDYSEQQRIAWVPERRSGIDWETRLDNQTVFVICVDDRAVGFMSLTDSGYVDLAFVRPAFQGQGIFRKLHESVQSLAVNNGFDRIWTHASLMARPAFAAVGFQVLKQESVEIRDQSFERFEMEKRLT